MQIAANSIPITLKDGVPGQPTMYMLRQQMPTQRYKAEFSIDIVKNNEIKSILVLGQQNCCPNECVSSLVFLRTLCGKNRIN